MNKRYEVSQKSDGQADGPDDVAFVLPDVDVEKFFHPGSEAFCGCLDARGREVMVELRMSHFEQRLPSQGSNHEEGEEGSEHSHRVLQANRSQGLLQKKGENDGEHSAPKRHKTIDDTQVSFEVVAQDDEGGVVD